MLLLAGFARPQERFYGCAPLLEKRSGAGVVTFPGAVIDRGARVIPAVLVEGEDEWRRDEQAGGPLLAQIEWAHTDWRRLVFDPRGRRIEKHMA